MTPNPQAAVISVSQLGVLPEKATVKDLLDKALGMNSEAIPKQTIDSAFRQLNRLIDDWNLKGSLYSAPPVPHGGQEGMTFKEYMAWRKQQGLR